MGLWKKLTEPNRKNPKKRFSDEMLKEMIVPLIIEQLLLMVVGMADTMMVSYAGEAAVSGVSLDTMIYTIFLMLFTALGTGGSVIVSQYIGNGNKDKANLSASQLFMIAGLFGILCSVVMLVCGNGLLNLLYQSVEPSVMDACQTYLWIVVLSFPANAVYNAATALYRSMGKTSVTMKVSMSMNIVNIVGNAIGIFVLHAGAAGVAVPTTVAWYYAAIVMTVCCYSKKNEVFVETKNIMRFDKDIVGRILHVAIPNSIENGLFQAAKVVLGSLIATFGTSQIAANGIGQTIWSLAASILTAMTPAFVTCVGQCMGANDIDGAEYYLWKLMRITTVVSFTWNIVIIVLLPVILSFYSISEETYHLIYIIVIIHNLACGTYGAFFSPFSAALRAAGDVKFTMFASIFCTVVFRTSLSFVLCLGFDMGVIGITLAMISDWALKSIMMMVRYKSGKWKNFQLIG